MSNDNLGNLGNRPEPGPGRPDEDATAELLGQALHDEAATVQTDPAALQVIQRHTARSGSSDPSRRSWVYAGVGAAAATAAVIAAVVVVGNNASDHATGPTTGTDKSVQDGKEQLPPVGVTVDVVLPALGTATEGFRLHNEPRSVPVPDGEDGRISALRAFLREGPVDPDYTTGWPTDLDVGGIATSNSSIQVDLTGPALTIEADPALTAQGRELAVQAMFRAAGAHPGDDATLRYNGVDLDEVFGVPLPVKLGDDAATRTHVDIDGLLDGQKVTSPVKVDVSGDTFEGTLNWVLKDSSDAKVDDGFVNVGSYGEWRSATVDLGALDPGTYTLTAIEYDMEAGGIANSDDKTFTVE